MVRAQTFALPLLVLALCLLAGRVAHDARVETLPTSYLEALRAAYSHPAAPHSRRWLRGYAVIVADRRWRATLIAALQRDPGWRQVAADGHAIAFLRIGEP